MARADESEIKQTEFEQFREFARKIVQVPKEELDEKLAQDADARKQTRKKTNGAEPSE